MNYSIQQKLALTVLALLLNTSNVCSEDQTPAAQAFALSALKMFDAGQCSKLYDAFDEPARTLTREQWIKVCSDTLKQRGTALNRSLASKAKSMGIYRFIFSTECSEGKVFEDVGVVYRDPEWKLVGFNVRPNI